LTRKQLARLVTLRTNGWGWWQIAERIGATVEETKGAWRLLSNDTIVAIYDPALA
jgi:hypothetical protein